MKKTVYFMLFLLTCISLGYSTGFIDIEPLFVSISSILDGSAFAGLDMLMNNPEVGLGGPILGAAFAGQLQSEIPWDDDLTAVAISYKDGKGIMDDLSPRVPVDKHTFKYKKLKKDEQYALPDTLVGRASAPNKVTVGLIEVPAICEDHGLDNPIPLRDLNEATEENKQLQKRNATTTIAKYIERGRELRGRNLLFNPANYSPNLQEQLTGNAQFNDYANSDPVTVILRALDQPLARPTVMGFGQEDFTTLRMHPKMVAACRGNSNDPNDANGVVALEAMREVFMLDKICVGQKRLNLNKPGQGLDLYRLWQNHICLLYVPEHITQDSTDTFGFTGQHGTRKSGEFFNKDIGLEGGIEIRCGESVKEVIVEQDYGYFIQNAFA